MQANLVCDGIPLELPASFLEASPFAGMSSNGVRCSTPDPTKYHDPASQALEGGGSLLQAAGGRYGVRGTIIPRGNLWGGSLGVDPHHARGVLNIDPGLKDGFTVDPTRYTPEIAAQAAAAATAACGRPGEIEPMRTKMAASFHFANTLIERAAQAPPVQSPILAPPPRLAPPPIVQHTNGVSPAAFAGHAPPARPEHDSAAYDPMPGAGTLPYTAPSTYSATPYQAPPQGVAAGRLLEGFAPARPRATPQEAPRTPQVTSEPAFDVHFDYGDAGDADAAYDSVIRQPGKEPGTGLLILGLRSDRRTRYFPPKREQPFALQVAGTGVALMVEATGVRFAHAGEDLFLMMVLAERPVEEGR